MRGWGVGVEARSDIGEVRPVLTRYYHLDHVHHGKKATRFVRAAQLPEVRRPLTNFKKLRRLDDQWVPLSLERAESLRQESAKTES